jgi:hypothetical protein
VVRTHQSRDRVDPGQGDGEGRHRDDADAPVSSELRCRHDTESNECEHEDRQQEHDTDGDEDHHGERVIVLCPHQDPVLLVVVGRQELQCCGQRHGLAERDAGEQCCCKGNGPSDRALRTLVESGSEEAPELPENHRQRECNRGDEADLQRRDKGLCNTQGHRTAPLGSQRLVQPVEQASVERKRGNQRDPHRSDGDEQAVPELVEMVDELQVRPLGGSDEELSSLRGPLGLSRRLSEELQRRGGVVVGRA